MKLGPITIRLTSKVAQEAAEAQRLSMVRSRVLVRLRADNEGMRHIIGQIAGGAASREAKAPLGAGATV